MIASVLIALAALSGAAGVVLLALAAHAAPGTGLDGAGSLLLLHAAAVIAAVTAVRQQLLRPTLGLTACAALLFGAALFAADITLRALAGHRLFPMAAPSGGTILILAWLALAIAALWRPPSK